jgi:RalA-binding protein 1
MFLTDFEAIFGLAIDEEKSPIREVTLSVQPPSDGIRSPRHQLFSELPTPAANQTSFQSMGGFQPLAHQGAAHRISTMQQSRAAQPSHDFNVPQQRQSHHQTQAQLYQQQQYQLQQQQYQQAEQYQQYRAYQQPVYNMQLAGSDSNFGSLDALTSQPTSQQRSGSLDTGDSKRGRRESAMMGMQIGLVGQRQTSRQTLRDTSSSRVPPSAQPTYS